jgi:hypothetical protein
MIKTMKGQFSVISAERAQAAFHIARKRGFRDIAHERVWEMLTNAYKSEFLSVDDAFIVCQLESVGANATGRAAD